MLHVSLPHEQVGPDIKGSRWAVLSSAPSAEIDIHIPSSGQRVLQFVLTVHTVVEIKLPSYMYCVCTQSMKRQRHHPDKYVKLVLIICNLICSLHEHILWIFKLIRRSFVTAVTFLSLMLPHTVLCVITIRCNILFTTIIACKGKMQVFPCYKIKIILYDLKCQYDKHLLPEKSLFNEDLLFFRL